MDSPAATAFDPNETVTMVVEIGGRKEICAACQLVDDGSAIEWRGAQARRPDTRARGLPSCASLADDEVAELDARAHRQVRERGAGKRGRAPARPSRATAAGNVWGFAGSPQREYRTWIFDSRRWRHYQPRPDDIIIATYPKCGTTWMQQRIVGLLVFQTPEPKSIAETSGWIDRRFPQPIEAVIAQIEAQKHRRFLKSHLPLDGLPFYDDVKYIHVASDGRDACMSFHNHGMSFTDGMIEGLNKAGMEDEAIARPYPDIPVDPRQFFHRWITTGEVPGHEDGSPSMSYFQFEKSWWEARSRPNVLLVHYNDLKSDLSGGMQRIADFLAISVARDLWPQLVAAAGFEAMRRDGDALLSTAAATFKYGGRGFFFKGTNERWRGVASDEDLALYEAKAEAMLSQECARWVARGGA